MATKTKTTEQTNTIQNRANAMTGVQYDTYKGNPLLVFGDGDARFPFSVGRGKLAKLVSAMDANGEDAVIQLIRDFVHTASADD